MTPGFRRMMYEQGVERMGVLLGLQKTETVQTRYVRASHKLYLSPLYCDELLYVFFCFSILFFWFVYLFVCPSVRVSSNSLLSTAALHGLDSADQRLNMVRLICLFTHADAIVFVYTCVHVCLCVFYCICWCVFWHMFVCVSVWSSKCKHLYMMWERDRKRYGTITITTTATVWITVYSL